MCNSIRYRHASHSSTELCKHTKHIEKQDIDKNEKMKTTAGTVSYEQRNMNKINTTQKKVMGEFMLQHPHLARTNIKYAGREGREMNRRLWSILTAKLNAEGPPFKNVRIWRKVFSDKKHRVKKKSSLNGEDRRRIDKNLSKADQQIMTAAGFDAVATAAPPPPPPIENVFTITEIEVNGNQQSSDIIEEPDEVLIEDTEFDYDDEFDEDGPTKDDETAVASVSGDQTSGTDYVLSLLNDRLKGLQESQERMNDRLDKLLQINERSLQMKEEEHTANMELKRMDLKIKTLELEMLKTKSVVNIFNAL